MYKLYILKTIQYIHVSMYIFTRTIRSINQITINKTLTNFQVLCVVYSVLNTSASPGDSCNSRNAYDVLKRTERERERWKGISIAAYGLMFAIYPSVCWESKLLTSRRSVSGNVVSNSERSTVLAVDPKLATYTILAAPESEVEYKQER